VTPTLLSTIRTRFGQNTHRHPGIAWADVEARIKTNKTAQKALAEMESTGGEPDVIGRQRDAFVFVDCAPESPIGRRSLCFDDAALNARKENKPKGSALGMAAAIGVELLSEDQYRALQTLQPFDLKTSSWIATPTAIRSKGGALFCDRRYDSVFTYHNGAESYYAARGFRARLVV
jgi:hypothetical protein